MCFSLSNFICSYTCKNFEKVIGHHPSCLQAVSAKKSMQVQFFFSKPIRKRLQERGGSYS
jgi:hypothetical protein